MLSLISNSNRTHAFHSVFGVLTRLTTRLQEDKTLLKTYCLLLLLLYAITNEEKKWEREKNVPIMTILLKSNVKSDATIHICIKIFIHGVPNRGCFQDKIFGNMFCSATPKTWNESSISSAENWPMNAARDATANHVTSCYIVVVVVVVCHLQMNKRSRKRKKRTQPSRPPTRCSIDFAVSTKEPSSKSCQFGSFTRTAVERHETYTIIMRNQPKIEPRNTVRAGSLTSPLIVETQSKPEKFHYWFCI